MIARRDDDRHAIERRGTPFTKQQLIVIILPPVHPITHLCERFGFGYPCRKGVVIGLREPVMYVAKHKDRRLLWRRVGLKDRERVVLRQTGPLGFFGHAEPRLPAEGADHCASR